MSSPIFDLEQQIMGCWGVVDDIDMLYKHFGDNPKFAGRWEASAEDEMMNLMLGVKSLYQLKFENMWETFEEVCRIYHENRKIAEKEVEIPNQL